MDEYTMEILLQESLELADALEGDQKIKRMRPFYEANLLTNNRGIVLTLQDGAEFQITIVQSKLAEFTE
jgi:hypothetical protein